MGITLFAVKINFLSKVIPASISYSLYVDDVQISFSSCSMPVCERQLQLAITKMTKWANENGFKFSTAKIVCIPFSLRRGLHPDPSLQLNGLNILVKN